MRQELFGRWGGVVISVSVAWASGPAVAWSESAGIVVGEAVGGSILRDAEAEQEALRLACVRAARRSGAQVITTLGQFLTMQPSGNYVLAANLDFREDSSGGHSRTEAPIREFRGNLSGCGYTLSNLDIAATNGVQVGLFGSLIQARVSGLNIEGFEIRGGSKVGVLAGSMTDGSTISDVSISDSEVTGALLTGGAVGLVQDSTASGVSVDTTQVLYNPNFFSLGSCSSVASSCGPNPQSAEPDCALCRESGRFYLDSGASSSTWKHQFSKVGFAFGGAVGQALGYSDVSDIQVNGISVEGTRAVGGAIGAVGDSIPGPTASAVEEWQSICAAGADARLTRVARLNIEASFYSGPTVIYNSNASGANLFDQQGAGGAIGTVYLGRSKYSRPPSVACSNAKLQRLEENAFTLSRALVQSYGVAKAFERVAGTSNSPSLACSSLGVCKSSLAGAIGQVFRRGTGSSLSDLPRIKVTDFFIRMNNSIPPYFHNATVNGVSGSLSVDFNSSSQSWKIALERGVVVVRPPAPAQNPCDAQYSIWCRYLRPSVIVTYPSTLPPTTVGQYYSVNHVYWDRTVSPEDATSGTSGSSLSLNLGNPATTSVLTDGVSAEAWGMNPQNGWTLVQGLYPQLTP